MKEQEEILRGQRGEVKVLDYAAHESSRNTAEEERKQQEVEMGRVNKKQGRMIETMKMPNKTHYCVC